jgi:hypothetical protein
MAKYEKKDIIQYLNILGVDVDEEQIKDRYKLYSICELFFKKKFDKTLPKSSRELSDQYGVLYSIIKDDFFYESEEYQQMAMDNCIGIISDLSSLQVTEPFDAEKNYERTNNLLRVIIAGLTEVEDLNRFGLFYKNADFHKLYYGKKNYNEMPEDLKILYLLMAYKKFEDCGRDHLIFDENDKITFDTLGAVIIQNEQDAVPIVERDKVYQKTLKRPSLRVLKEENYDK